MEAHILSHSFFSFLSLHWGPAWWLSTPESLHSYMNKCLLWFLITLLASFELAAITTTGASPVTWNLSPTGQALAMTGGKLGRVTLPPSQVNAHRLLPVFLLFSLNDEREISHKKQQILIYNILYIKYI